MVQRTATWNDTDFSSADAGRVARDEETVRRGFWRRLRAFAARLPFVEDLLAAYYCAFDRETPLQVKAALFGALAYFVLPFDADSRHAAGARLRRRCRGAGDRAADGGKPSDARAPRGGEATLDALRA